MKDGENIIIAITQMKKIEVQGSGFHRAIMKENFLLLNVELFYSNSNHVDSCYIHLVSVEGWQILQIIQKLDGIQRKFTH